MKVTYRFLLLNIALLIFVSTSSRAVGEPQLYKWVDEQGKVTYQSGPPPEGALDVEESNISIGSGVEEAEPAENIEIDPVKFYTKPDCPVCDDARDYLETESVPFEEVDISEDSTAAKMERAFGHTEVPTMKIGNKSVMGFQKKMLDTILKKAGYDITAEEATEDNTEEDTEKGTRYRR